MTDRTTDHGTFVIERVLHASPAKVFHALSDPATKVRWFTPPPEWAKSDHQLDFGVGGSEHLSVSTPDGSVHTFDARYHDIVADERVIFTYDMYIGTERMSVSLTTIELRPAGDATKLVFTEQVVFLDGRDELAAREEGSQALLDNLRREVEGDAG
jgi:uncharacterized protein YndB with AHSA1/START domain